MFYHNFECAAIIAVYSCLTNFCLKSFIVSTFSFSLSLSAADVLSEDVILKWYKDSHSAKGKSVFLNQMKQFVEWLRHAEEGKVI